MTIILSFIAGALTAIVSATVHRRLTRDRLKELPMEGSLWLIEGKEYAIRSVYSSIAGTTIYLRGVDRGMSWAEFCRRAKRPNAEHLIQSMHRPRIVKQNDRS